MYNLVQICTILRHACSSKSKHKLPLAQTSVTKKASNMQPLSFARPFAFKPDMPLLAFGTLMVLSSIWILGTYQEHPGTQ